MTNLSGQHILSVDQFDRETLSELYRTADLLQPVALSNESSCPVLEGATLANLFFEPSTRTRTSFGAAFHQLGGKIVETTDEKYSSLVKGESLEDTARVIGGYADVVVVRHHESGSVNRYADASEIPVINAGDGAGEHPSQALLDAYTIAHELGRGDYDLDGITIALIGDLKHGRTVHSLAKLLSKYEGITFNFVSPAQLRMPRAIRDRITEQGNSYIESRLLRDGLPQADIIYATRIQEERFAEPRTAAQYRGRLAIDRATYEHLAPHLPPIMHPLPRDSRVTPMELATDLDNLDSFAAFRQARHAVPVRMALFAAVLGIERGFLKYEMKPSFVERQNRWREKDKVIDHPTKPSPTRERPVAKG
jgi:aspartate carbamoyltransferase catalytic subunit